MSDIKEKTYTHDGQVRYDPECPSCQDDDKWAPNHYNSSYCESGKQPHCTCDRCF